MSNIRESVIENYLKKRVREVGGRAYKWVCPGVSGVPDRICVLPGNIIFFVETKATGEKPRALQRVKLRELARLGAHVWVASSKEEIDMIILKEVNGCAICTTQVSADSD